MRRYEFKALEDLFKKNSKGKGEVEGKLGGEELKEHRKYQQWLEKSRCSKAPTGRLPSLEDTLTEAQKLEIETAKLRKKKERQVAGQVHFQSWLKKKWGEEKVKIAQTLEKEKEDLGVELPPINLLDSAKVDAVCQLVQKEGAPEECTAVRVRAAFMCFARELGIEFAAADLTAAVKTEMDSLDKGNELAHKSILTLWRKNSKDLVLKSIDKLFKEGETTSIGNFRKVRRASAEKELSLFARMRKSLLALSLSLLPPARRLLLLARNRRRLLARSFAFFRPLVAAHPPPPLHLTFPLCSSSRRSSRAAPSSTTPTPSRRPRRTF